MCNPFVKVKVVAAHLFIRIFAVTTFCMNDTFYLLFHRVPAYSLVEWLLEKAEQEANLPLFEKKDEDQLYVPLVDLRSEFS